MRENGFTLVEMLVALLIFGMLTAAGVALLSFSVRAQEASDAHLGELSEVRRAAALLAADLGQAAPRLYRDERGSMHRAFAGGTGSEATALTLVRRGWENHDGAARPTLQRVEYRLRSETLERVHYPLVDGAAAMAPVALMTGVDRLAIRYRAADGRWREQWAPENPADLPLAVELSLETRARGTIRQLFLVGAAT